MITSITLSERQEQENYDNETNFNYENDETDGICHDINEKKNNTSEQISEENLISAENSTSINADNNTSTSDPGLIIPLGDESIINNEILTDTVLPSLLPSSSSSSSSSLDSSIKTTQISRPKRGPGAR